MRNRSSDIQRHGRQVSIVTNSQSGYDVTLAPSEDEVKGKNLISKKKQKNTMIYDGRATKMLKMPSDVKNTAVLQRVTTKSNITGFVRNYLIRNSIEYRSASISVYVIYLDFLSSFWCLTVFLALLYNHVSLMIPHSCLLALRQKSETMVPIKGSTYKSKRFRAFIILQWPGWFSSFCHWLRLPSLTWIAPLEEP